mmetsp:Transcript_22401/g.59703  ORF Transcript_22401/g.59703 Transcript_22401/m.59703 type:complete len:254 (+) Transcript_22401:1584-2345(+)
MGELAILVLVFRPELRLHTAMLLEKGSELFQEGVRDRLARLGLLLRMVHSVEAVLQHGARQLGLQHEDRRVHPGLLVPERVPVVPVRRQPPGRDAVGPVVADRRADVVERGIQRLREAQVALHLQSPAVGSALPLRGVGFPEPRGRGEAAIAHVLLQRAKRLRLGVVRLERGHDDRQGVERALLVRREGDARRGLVRHHGNPRAVRARNLGDLVAAGYAVDALLVDRLHVQIVAAVRSVRLQLNHLAARPRVV